VDGPGLRARRCARKAWVVHHQRCTVRLAYLECRAVCRTEVTKCATQYMLCPRATSITLRAFFDTGSVVVASTYDPSGCCTILVWSGAKFPWTTVTEGTRLGRELNCVKEIRTYIKFKNHETTDLDNFFSFLIILALALHIPTPSGTRSL
jgi:hypothetical protein